MAETTTLRPVTPEDLPILFAHQMDPVASAMAMFPSRQWAEFEAHWSRIISDPTALARNVAVDGAVAGNVVAFERGGITEVGYWIGQEYWNRGIATSALSQFVSGLEARPLWATVGEQNIPSIRVLEKVGFTVSSHRRGNDGFNEVVLILSHDPEAERP